MVCFAAVGFVAGAAIGMGFGMAFGAWSGPGAFVTGALGFIAGGITGAMTAVAVCAGITSLSALALSGGLIFKPWGLRKEALDVVAPAKRFVMGGS